MLVYILKSVACLAILFAFYKLFLEKENMHRFKRFYLLGALLSSLLIPLVVLTEYVEVTPLPEIQLETMQAQTTEDVINIPPALEADVIDFAPILWGIYFVGLFFFGLKFIINLFQILGRIRKNPKNKLARFTQVLLIEKLPPHTFFKYIFLNKTKFESNQIPKEVLLHEETHAAQKHSIDVVFVELLQVIFWVNPFIYFAKKAMKLNHEFLADQAVLQNNIDAISYKNTLLSYLSPDSQYTQEPQMANSINYSSIKKRFTVMKTQTSKKAALLRSLVILPLLALMIYGFSETKIETFSNEALNNGLFSQEDVLQETPNSYSNQPSVIQLTNWQDHEKFSIWIDEKHVSNNTLNKSKPSDFGHYNLSFVHKNALSEKFPQPYQVSLYTKEVYEKYIKRDLEVLEIYINSDEQILIKNQIVPLEEINAFFEKFINHEKLLKVNIRQEEKTPSKLGFEIEKLITKYDIPEITISQSNTQITINGQGPSLEEISKYNKLARSHNLFSDHGIRPRESEIREVELIYIRMSEKQKRNAEVFPNYPAIKRQFSSTEREITPFLISIKKRENSIRLKCETGCKWADITLDTNTKSKYIINDFGFSEGNTLATDKFAFTIEPTNDGVVLDGLKGTAWLDLSFSIEKNNYRKINHEGVGVEYRANEEKKESKLILKYDEKGRLYLNNKTILFENLLEKLGNADFIEINESIKAHIYAKNASDTKINELIHVLWDAGITAENVGVISEIPTKKQIEEYNALAKKYNTMLAKNKSIQIKRKDVERLEYIYGLMSDKQKKKAESFPDFPPLPPMPEAPEAPEPPEAPENIDKNELENQLENEEIYDEVVKQMVFSKDVRFEDEDAPLVVNPKPIISSTTHSTFNFSASKDSKNKVTSSNYTGEYSFQEDDPLKPKESYASQLIELNEKEAIFYHKGEKISFYKALDLVYSKRNLMLAAIHPNKNGKPIVILDRNLKKYNLKKMIDSTLQ